jgi:hypothetical protein
MNDLSKEPKKAQAELTVRSAINPSQDMKIRIAAKLGHRLSEALVRAVRGVQLAPVSFPR